MANQYPGYLEAPPVLLVSGVGDPKKIGKGDHIEKVFYPIRAAKIFLNSDSGHVLARKLGGMHCLYLVSQEFNSGHPEYRLVMKPTPWVGR